MGRSSLVAPINTAKGNIIYLFHHLPHPHHHSRSHSHPHPHLHPHPHPHRHFPYPHRSFNSDLKPDDLIASSIMQRCGRLCPSLLDSKKTMIIKHSVGLRPYIKGSTTAPRIEIVDEKFGIIHCILLRSSSFSC